MRYRGFPYHAIGRKAHEGHEAPAGG